MGLFFWFLVLRVIRVILRGGGEILGVCRNGFDISLWFLPLLRGVIALMVLTFVLMFGIMVVTIQI